MELAANLPEVLPMKSACCLAAFLAHYNVVGLELDEGFACQLAV